MRVECYYNLHKRTFSVRALSGPDKGHVILHGDSVSLTEAEFIVQPAGRAKVLREGRKNVHAFVRGTLAPELLAMPLDAARITYNPFKADYFFERNSGARVSWALRVSLVKHDGKPVILSTCTA